MKKQELKNWVYETPECRVIQLESEQFICTSCTSVLPKPESEEEDWEEEEEDGGVIRQS